MTSPADPRFPLGTRVRIVAVPELMLQHLIGYTGEICRVHPDDGTRNLTVCFPFEDGRPDSGGFWTFAAEHLELVHGEPTPTPQLALEMP